MQCGAQIATQQQDPSRLHGDDLASLDKQILHLLLADLIDKTCNRNLHVCR